MVSSQPGDPIDPAAKHPGERLASYFENFFRTITGVSTLGASITFTNIVKAPVTPFHNFGFSSQRIQYLISLSWLFFVLALALTSFFASALSLWRPQAVKAFGTTTGADRVKVLWFATGVSAFLFGLEVAAFLTVSLVVTAYTGPVGWVAVGFVIIFGMLGFGVIIWRSPMTWPALVRRPEREEMDMLGRHVGTHREREGEKYETGLEYGGEQLPAIPRQRSRPERAERKGGKEYAYGRSTSGEYREQATADWRSSRRKETDGFNRYSRASTVLSEAYDPGTFGQQGMVYDDGIREGLVMSRYTT